MDEIEQRINESIHQHHDEIIAFGRDILCHAEMGYKEFRTAGKIADCLQKILSEVETGLAITGVKGYLKPKGTPGRTVALIGEMDGLPIPDHPQANPETGASHSCGHNTQVAAMIGAALVLSDPAIQEALDGNVIFMGVPAEEFVDISFKNDLIRQGKIGYGGGKCELIRIGAFDDVDIAVGHHTMVQEGLALANHTTNGFVNKTVTFHGRTAHAADAPHNGIDALNAAMLALHGVDMQREGYRDEDGIRVHSFLPEAGTAMNIIPDRAVIESSVRANNVDAYVQTSERYDRAMKAGALALGCDVDITTLPGYLPVHPVKEALGLKEALQLSAQLGGYPLQYREQGYHENGSTDYGDLSCYRPVLQFRTGGATGALHNPNLTITDEELAYIEPARIFALTACNLLKNGAVEAEQICRDYHQSMTKEAYIRYMDSMSKTEHFSAGVL